MGKSRRSCLYLRATLRQHRLVAERGQRIGVAGVIVSMKYLVRLPSDTPGADGNALLDAAVEADLPVLLDPGSPALQAAGIAKLAAGERLRSAPMAKAVSLPLAVATLRVPRVRDGFVDATLEMQSRARAVSPPNLEFMNLHDPRFALNLAMLDRAVTAKGQSGVVPFIQVTRHRLMNGTLARAAGAYGRRKIRLLVIRVRGLDCENATAEEVAAYVRAIQAFRRAGAEVLCDSVGRLGAVLVAAGAYGVAAGDPHFRRVPETQISSGGNSPSSVRYEIFNGFRDVDRHVRSSLLLPKCPIESCRAAESDVLDDLREHNLHSLGALIDFAADRPLRDFIRLLQRSQDPIAAQWAEALSLLERQIA